MQVDLMNRLARLRHAANMEHEGQVSPVYMSYGGGLNSTAMLVGVVERGERLDGVFFADTGGERPDVYEVVQKVSQWSRARGYPEVQTVRWTRKKTSKFASKGEFLSLEGFCLKRKELPSLAYGMKGCSVKWKSQPLDDHVRQQLVAQQAIASGHKVVRLIGYGADEPHRTKRNRDTSMFTFRYPLAEWDWGREECSEAVARAGLGEVAKSACFFCPAHSELEVAQLGRLYPHLLSRALALEANAESTVGREPSLGGLSRRTWREVWAAAQRGEKLQGRSMELPCGCFDGDSQ